MNTVRNFPAFLLIAVMVYVELGQAPTPLFGIGFRYDESRIISYVARMEDPVTIKMDGLKPLKDPVTRDSSCGYHLGLTAERLNTFKLIAGTVPRVGQSLTVIPNGSTTIAASVEGYIEEWQGDSNVAVAILAQVLPADRIRFQNAKSGYFLISTQSKPAPPPIIPDPNPILRTKTKEVLNRFGALGDLIERTGEAPGREIRLFRTNRGSLQPTAVEISCQD